MNRDILGIYGHGGAAPAARVRRVLGDQATVVSQGPMVVGFTGPGSDEQDGSAGPLCVLDGTVHQADRLAGALGMRSDTRPEALLASAYARWGEAMLEHTWGEFVILVWDRERGCGLLARDQVGVRPLFVHDVGGSLIFASEVRLLLDALPRRPEPDPIAVVHWLCRTGAGRGRTLYEGVRPVGPGRLLRFDGRRLSERRYWSGGGSPLRLGREEAAERVRSAMADAIRVRTQRDDLVGVALSGGLDSSSIAAVASKVPAAGGRRLRAYSAVFPDHGEVDESSLIGSVVATLGLTSVRMAVHGCSALMPALRYMDTWQVPLAPPNHFVWVQLLRRAADDGASVMLSGAGGDELFGASGYLVSDRLARGRLRSAWQMAGRLPGRGDDPSRRTLLRAMTFFGTRGLLPHGLHRAAWRAGAPERHVPAHLNAASAKLFADNHDPYPWKRLPGPRWRAHLLDSVTDGPDAMGVHDYLRRRATDAGLESRQPLLDARLLQLVLSLPPELAYDANLNRPLLRQAAGDLLPPAVSRRPDKHYFDALLTDALLGDDAGVVRWLLRQPSAEVNAFVQPGYVADELLGRAPGAYSGGPHAWSKAAWRVLTLECWLRSQGDPAFSSSVAERFGIDEPQYSFVA